MEKLLVSQLETLQDSKETDSKTLEVINIILESLNDWPVPISDLSEFDLQITNFIKGAATESAINKALTEINLTKNAWQAESLSQLVSIFRFYKNETTLNEIIIDLKQKI